MITAMLIISVVLASTFSRISDTAVPIKTMFSTDFTLK